MERLRDFASVLIRPAETMRHVLDAHARRLVLPLAIAASISAVLGERDREVSLLAGVLNVAVLVGLFYVFAAIAYAAGRFLGGTGAARDVRAALAWGLMPVICAMVWRLPLAIVRPGTMLIDVGDGGFHFSNAPAGGCLMMLLALAAELTVLAWTIIVSAHTVSEAHRFSWTRGLATIAMAAVAPVIIAIAALLTAMI
ncbi:MAG TPA: YIP1 family protein [Thermoanaerobaculia bacterium]|nr:YIP1 family protein [Thermoanaerobaculia bacterium]